MSVIDKILILCRQFYPTGRAFWMPVGGILESVHKALNISEAKAYNDALSTLDSIIPDNLNFTEDDATQWERRLGLITQEGVLLSDRKLAIIRKMNFPGSQPARQNYLFLQGQLQKAGFDVYVYENRFDDGMGGYYTRGPLDVTGGIGGTPVQYGDYQMGDTQYGELFTNLIVNNINEAPDKIFDIGTNLRSTFFIGGPTLGSFANVPSERKNEFRKLILTIKPVQTVGYLFINYV